MVLAADELIQVTADRIDPPLHFRRRSLCTYRGGVALGSVANGNEVVVDLGAGGMHDPLSAGKLCRVVGDKLLQRRRPLRKGPSGPGGLQDSDCPVVISASPVSRSTTSRSRWLATTCTS
jgi:hypothetical protein